MKRSCGLWLLLMALLSFSRGQAQMAIGQWSDCFDFSVITHVAVANGEVYAAGRTGLFRYRVADQSVAIMGKASGMSDVGVEAMAYDSQSGCLAVAYTNANIDLVIRGEVYNIPDIKRSSLPGDKSIYHIRFHNRCAYLATGFGIVVIDVARHEIKDTWYIGADGSRTTVYDLAFGTDSIYAATSEGLKTVALSERHPNIASRWRVDSSHPGTTITQLAYSQGALAAVAYGIDPLQQALIKLLPTGDDTLLTGDIRALQTGGGFLVASTSRGIWRFNADMSLSDSLTLLDGWADLSANDAVADSDSNLWIGHTWIGLVKMSNNGNQSIRPNGPEAKDNVFRLIESGSKMIVCPGGHTTTYSNSYIAPTLPIANGQEWATLHLSDGLPSGAVDIVDARINPQDSTELFVALWGTGIAAIKNGQVTTLYDETTTNGALHRYTEGTYSTLRIGALTFAPDGTLWALNSSSASALVARQPNGTWKNYSTAALSPLLEVDKLLLDSITGYLWFAGRNNAIYVHDGNNRLAKINPNNGSKLQTQAVNAMVQDRNGNIWIGTDQGIKVIYDAGRVFSGGGMGETATVNCSNITISDRGIYEYLMAYENITSIAIDGANRKWIGTAAGGLYLISADGLSQLRHFTANESPLLSDKITSLALLPDGYLYIGTDRGLQIYRTDATVAHEEPEEQVYAYPNPVRPDYDGPVAIKGLAHDAFVHITDASGHTIYSTQALGGQAIWNLRTNEGTPVVAGVYYVFAATPEASGRSVAKILVIK